MKLKKIISGGQIGADRAGLEIAKELGFETGGAVPKGYRTENGPDLSLKEFGCVEHASSDWTPRTYANVSDSDATVIFGDVRSPGSRSTRDFCDLRGKPCLANPTAYNLVVWLCVGEYEILNVAGNRESTNPGIGEKVKRILREALQSPGAQDGRLDPADGTRSGG